MLLASGTDVCISHTGSLGPKLRDLCPDLRFGLSGTSQERYKAGKILASWHEPEEQRWGTKGEGGLQRVVPLHALVTSPHFPTWDDVTWRLVAPGFAQRIAKLCCMRSFSHGYFASLLGSHVNEHPLRVISSPSSG